jgi:asparagine synthetase B (glutamine-hydrolysing)
VLAAQREQATGCYYQPTSFEIATSWLHGLLPRRRLPRVEESPRAALEALIEQAVVAAPCFVLFSGGRDSSALLAVATRVARHIGAPDPLPVTEIYPDVPESNESEWQRLVIGHLGLRAWRRIEVSNENDLLGRTARAGLRKRGLIWPPALQIKSTVLEHLAGGSILTGDGGDEVFGERRVAAVRHCLMGDHRYSMSSSRSAIAAVAPALARRAWLRAKLERSNLQPWLHNEVRHVHHRLLARDMATEPLPWQRSVWWLHRRRYSAISLSNYKLLAAESGARLSMPLLEPRFLAAVASARGPLGYQSRTAAMRDLFGDVLPSRVIERSSKAYFNRAYVGVESREFAKGWDGSGVDATLVDAERLREEWLSAMPSAISTLLLQSAWLKSVSRQ